MIAWVRCWRLNDIVTSALSAVQQLKFYHKIGKSEARLTFTRCSYDMIFNFSGAMTNMERDNTRFVHGQQQMTQEMIGQQDVALDSLGNAVDRLEGMGRTINTELKGI